MKKRKILSEAELSGFRKNDDYQREKLVRNVTTYLLLGVLSFLALVFVWAVIFESTVRGIVIEQIRSNFVALVLSAIYILGINRMYLQGKDDKFLNQ